MQVLIKPLLHPWRNKVTCYKFYLGFICQGIISVLRTSWVIWVIISKTIREGVPRLLLGYHDLYQTQITTERVICTLTTFSTHQGHNLRQKGMVVVLGNHKATQGYWNTLQGFWQCTKGSKGFKGFRLGLGQSQKVFLDTDTYSTLKGSSRSTKTH